MIFPKKYICWDLETSGLDPVSNKILEIGAARFEDGVLVEKKSWMLNHNIVIPEVITKITTITKSQIDSEGVDPHEAVNEFLSWFDRYGWANLTHNGFKFDIPFLIQAIFVDGVHKIGDVEKIKDSLYRHGIDTAALYKAGQLGMQRLWNENFMQFADRVLNTRVAGLRYNIAHCCKELGIDSSQEQMHRALGDVSLTSQIYEKLMAQESVQNNETRTTC